MTSHDDSPPADIRVIPLTEQFHFSHFKLIVRADGQGAGLGSVSGWRARKWSELSLNHCLGGGGGAECSGHWPSWSGAGWGGWREGSPGEKDLGGEEGVLS